MDCTSLPSQSRVLRPPVRSSPQANVATAESKAPAPTMAARTKFIPSHLVNSSLIKHYNSLPIRITGETADYTFWDVLLRAH